MPVHAKLNSTLCRQPFPFRDDLFVRYLNIVVQYLVQGWGDGVFNQLFKCYQGEQAVSADAGPDGLSCKTQDLLAPQPIPQLQQHTLVLYRNRCLLGEQKAAVDNFAQFILGLQWVASEATTGSKPWKYSWLK